MKNHLSDSSRATMAIFVQLDLTHNENRFACN